MRSSIIHIIFLFLIGILLSMTSCSKKCQVNGCRVRMEHRHDGKEFKSRVRRWYTFQNPRVGRDYKRDIPPEKIPWDGPDIEGAEGTGMLASNDTGGFDAGDSFMGDQFYEGGEDDPWSDDFTEDSVQVGNAIVAEDVEEDKKSKKKRRKRGEEETPVQTKPADPWNIENIGEDEPVIAAEIIEQKRKEIEARQNRQLEQEELEDKDKKDEKKEKEKSKKEIAKEQEEKREKLLEEEEEDLDDWGF